MRIIIDRYLLRALKNTFLKFSSVLFIRSQCISFDTRFVSSPNKAIKIDNYFLFSGKKIMRMFIEQILRDYKSNKMII